VTDILRDEALLPFYRKAGLIHVSLGTEAAAQLKLDLFNKETTVAQNKKAVQLLRDAGIVVEAQFIVGLENETAETLEETYRMACDWKPDLANWSMYTPWPFSDLFKELGDKVEVFDYEKYNFVTPIMRPDAMDRAELLDRVMNNYRRFYMKKALFSYPFAGTGDRRKYLTALIMIDEDNVIKYAQDHKIQFATYKDLTLDEDIRNLIQAEVDQVNTQVARVENVRKFAILPKKLYEEDGEVTPTMKVKRKFVNEAFGELIDSMY